MGSRLHADFVAPCDDVSIARLRSAGAVLAAKTNISEFALGAYTDNLLFGPTRNPWDLSMGPGGSSGGAVAALAAGMGALAVGSDAGGSIRRPASYAGVVGFRPSTGRIPRAVGFPVLSHDFQALSPAARTVDDVYLLFRLMAGPDRRDRASACFSDASLPDGLDVVSARRSRIRCIFDEDGAAVEAVVRKNVMVGAQTLGSLGHHVEMGAPPYDAVEIDWICATLGAAGLAHAVASVAGWKERVHPSSRAMVERGLMVSAFEYLDALKATTRFRLEMATCFESVDFLLMPTSASLPWLLEKPWPSHIDGVQVGPKAASIFSMFVNVAGLPAISVPVTPAEGGIPIGMQLVGPYGSDLSLLNLARDFERAAPWQGRWPSLTNQLC